MSKLIEEFTKAIKTNDVATLERLVRDGFPVNQVIDDKGTRAIHIAAESGHVRAIQILLQAGRP